MNARATAAEWAESGLFAGHFTVRLTPTFAVAVSKDGATYRVSVPSHLFNIYPNRWLVERNRSAVERRCYEFLGMTLEMSCDEDDAGLSLVAEARADQAYQAMREGV